MVKKHPAGRLVLSFIRFLLNPWPKQFPKRYMCEGRSAPWGGGRFPPPLWKCGRGVCARACVRARVRVRACVRACVRARACIPGRSCRERARPKTRPGGGGREPTTPAHIRHRDKQNMFFVVLQRRLWICSVNWQLLSQITAFST